MTTGTRRCNRCRKLFPATADFFPPSGHRFKGTGYRYLRHTCKRCYARQQLRSQSTPAAKQRRARWWKKYSDSGLLRAWHREYRLRNLSLIRLARRIRHFVKRAVERGELVKGHCRVCGDERVEAHHEDYTKPREVWWLCREHHAARHRRLNQLQWASRVEATMRSVGP